MRSIFNDSMTLRLLAMLIGASALVGGAVTMIGWLAGLPRLTDWDNDGISMMFNTALAASCSGLAVLLLQHRQPHRGWSAWSTRICGSFVTIIGGLTLFEHVTGINLGIDTFIVDSQWGFKAAASPGRMGPPASGTFLLLGTAIVLATARPRSTARRTAATIALLASIVPLISMTAYFYRADPLYSLPHITGIARQSAIILFFLAVALAISIVEFGLGALLRRDDAAGTLVRRLLPLIIILMLLTGRLEDLGLELGYYEAAFGNAVLTVVRIVMFTALLWWTAAAIAHQIEQRTAADAERRRSEERLRIAVSTADIGAWDYDPITQVIEWSDRCKAIFGLEPNAQVSYESFLELLHPDDRERTHRAVNNALDPEGDGHYEVEYRAVWPDGSLRWIAARGQVYFAGRSAKRRAIRFLGTVLDITERKLAHARLEEEVRTTETLNRIGRVIAAELDQDKLVQQVTDAATRLTEARFGAFFYNTSDDQGDAYWLYSVSGVAKDEFEHFPIPRVTPLFKPVFQGKRIIRADDITANPRFGRAAPHFGMPDGHLPVRSFLAVPVVSRRGSVIGALFFGHPEPGVFTERHEQLASGVAAQAAIALDNASLFRRAQEQAEMLRESDQRKDEFLATLGHELRNPLGAIRSSLRLLAIRRLEGDELADITSILDRQSAYLGRLIDDLLDVSRITRGKIELQNQAVDLCALLSDTVNSCRAIADCDAQQLELHLPDHPVQVVADPARITQIITNLIDNACKYSPREARIDITLEREGSDAVISIRDPGIGIEPDMLEIIFDMFSQADTAIEQSRGGLGIGLTLVRRLIELHGGTVTAASDGPNRGSTFTIRLPSQLGNIIVDTSSGPAAPAEARHRRILLVDDNVDAATSLAALLRHEGHTVSIAHDGRRALHLAGTLCPEVILLDIGLPRMNGYDVCRAIRATATGQDMSIIAMTGWGQDEDRRRAAEAGFDLHLTKPVDLDHLFELIRDSARDRPAPPV